MRHVKSPGLCTTHRLALAFGGLGLLMAVLYALYIWGRCTLQPDLAPTFEVQPTPLRVKLEAGVRNILPIGFIVFAVVGVIEREGATLYCTVLYFDGAKGLVGKHRKLMPTAHERLIWGFGDGSTLTVVESPWGPIGSVICWENYMPMLRMAMYGKGVRFYCAPTADDRETWLPSMRHIALEGRCFVLTACQYIRRSAFPEAVRVSLGDGPDAVLMRGRT